MKHAILTFGRSRTKTLTVSRPGHSDMRIPEEEAAEKVALLQEIADADHSGHVADVVEKRAAWRSTFTVRSNATEEVKVGVFKSETRAFDEITQGSTVERLEAGSAEAVLNQRAEIKFPVREAVKVRTHTPEDIRSWSATFFEGGQATQLERPTDLGWPYGFPAEWVIAELDRLTDDGWTLLNVSEDHGLYQGVDAFDESFVTRVRYLFGR